MRSKKRPPLPRTANYKKSQRPRLFLKKNQKSQVRAWAYTLAGIMSTWSWRKSP
jgi:hypothetical protein